MCTPLFISAATILRFLRDQRTQRKGPDVKIDFMLNSKFSKASSQYAQLYRPVLDGAMGDVPGEGDDLEDFKDTLGAIVLLANPLSEDSLSKLLGKDMVDIESQLDLLHSVLDIPEEDGPIRLFHLSFRDISWMNRLDHFRLWKEWSTVDCSHAVYV